MEEEPKSYINLELKDKELIITDKYDKENVGKD